MSGSLRSNGADLSGPIPVARGDFDLAWLEWDETYAVVTPE